MVSEEQHGLWGIGKLYQSYHAQGRELCKKTKMGINKGRQTKVTWNKHSLEGGLKQELLGDSASKSPRVSHVYTKSILLRLWLLGKEPCVSLHWIMISICDACSGLWVTKSPDTQKSTRILIFLPVITSPIQIIILFQSLAYQ